LQSVKPYNLQEIMKSVSTNGAFGTFTNVFSINADFWADLPEDVQTVMSNCGLAVERSIAARMDAESVTLAEEFAALGIDVFEFDEASAAEINGQLADVLNDWVERLNTRGLPAADVLANYQAIMSEL
jgi:TRAP-type transport system periplasmic protein